MCMCLELSAAQRASLENERKAAEKRLTEECTQLRREMETVLEEKKCVESQLETQRQTSAEQVDRQRQGNTAEDDLSRGAWDIRIH